MMVAMVNKADPGLMEQIFSDPLLVEVILVFLVLVVGLLLFLLGRRFSRDVRKRMALGNLVGGLDAYLRKRWENAIPRLENVLDKDPDNHEARVVLGDCYRETGRLDEAERLHLEAIQVFNDQRMVARLSLAKDLLALERPREALEWLEEGVPDDQVDALELAAKALEMLGRSQEAARRLERLIKLEVAVDLPGGKEALERRIGSLLLAEAQAAEGEGRLEEALSLFRRALSWSCALNQARSGVVAQLRALGREAEAAAELQRHLRELDRLAGDPEFRMLPSAGVAGEVASPLPGQPALPLHGTMEEAGQLPVAVEETGPLLQKLIAREALFLCQVCAKPLSTSPEKCPACGALGSVVPVSSSLTRELADVDDVIDEIEENETYIRRLIGRLCEREEDAFIKLERVGERALPSLFEELFREADREPVFELLRRMGVGVLPPLLAIHRQNRKDGNTLARRFFETFGTRKRPFCDIGAAFGKVAEAEEFFLGLCESGEEDERRAVMEYLVSSARPTAFEPLRGFARVEVINFLSDQTAERLVPLFLNLAQGDFLIDWMLTDKTLQVEEGLMEAFGHGGNREVIAAILKWRGFHPRVEKGMQCMLCHETARPEAHAILESFGKDALAHRLPVLLDPEFPDEAREVLTEMVISAGEEAVSGIILECLGTKPSPVDHMALDLIARFGDQALSVLRRIYREEEGLFAKFPLVRNRSKRRRELVMRAIGRIPGGGKLLAEIVSREQDETLRDRARELLRERNEKDGPE